MSRSKILQNSSSTRCNLLSEILSNMTVALIRLYQMLFSSILGSVFGTGCRFTPTCSSYAREAFQKNGFFIGLLKTLGRLCRCHPWGSHGHDPVEAQSQSKRISNGA